eukprot:767800-Hanusia_phi.AAC.4
MWQSRCRWPGPDGLGQLGLGRPVPFFSKVLTPGELSDDPLTVSRLPPRSAARMPAGPLERWTLPRSDHNCDRTLLSMQPGEGAGEEGDKKDRTEINKHHDYDRQIMENGVQRR